MSRIEHNLENREWLHERLKAEIIGPDPPIQTDAIELDIPDDNHQIIFESWDEFNKPKKQKNGEEILFQDPPATRYGAGILFPAECLEQDVVQEENDYESNENESEDEDVEIEIGNKQKIRKNIVSESVEEIYDYDVNLSNAWKPSAMGLSFLADLEKENDKISVVVEFAYYRNVSALIKNPQKPESARSMWFRIPGKDDKGNAPVVSISVNELLEKKGKIEKDIPGFENSGLCITAICRNYSSEGKSNICLITLCLVNRKNKGNELIDRHTFYQCGIRVRGSSQQGWILPYHERSIDSLTHEEERINRLLYRKYQTFAVGHGCAALWQVCENTNMLANEVKTECMPTYETSSISPVVRDINGNAISISMYKLAGMDPATDGFEQIKNLTDAYKDWIEDKLAYVSEDSNKSVLSGLDNTARGLLKKCRECLLRIEDGVDFLRCEGELHDKARKAFQLANQAMYIVQKKGRQEKRKATWNENELRYHWDKEYPDIDLEKEDKDIGYWRPFQIAFLLQTIRGICEPEDESRNIVDLIWFPTGGGKTEAYLALTAFTIFFNRLYGRISNGADVIMRYTLRLLTTQQFERAGLLFCSMEYIRQLNPELGKKPFRLGMWVGGDTSPNNQVDAVQKLKQLEKDPERENPFVLLKCPWCGASMGPQKNEGTRKKGRRHTVNREIPGYKKVILPNSKKQGFNFQCADNKCNFNKKLPITVIDEDIYECPPNLVIGTVDKFAMLAWKPEIRNIFGIGYDGNREGIPPSLIIQDELHLISGPLGSMVGLYETVIEEACTCSDNGVTIKPKIVASTATISRATEQVKALYARDCVQLFPPTGIDASDSFFAREDVDESGKRKPGRLYVGIMAPGHGSQQTTQARVYAALIQYPVLMPIKQNEEDEKDPWWTLLCFYNSLRELGGAATLLLADTQDYFRVILGRHGYDYKLKRQTFNIKELTSRIRDDDIPKAIEALESHYCKNEKGPVTDAVDVCLASNIIEVGIDINRLSLMTIIGQPKTTSQYIQVSSRIGRNTESPGLVVCVYNSGKPRDRSHYEKFVPYHQRLYAQVEPTSVTPFSPPALDRGLHAVLTAMVRQLFEWSMADNSRPCPLNNQSVVDRIRNLVLERVSKVDKNEKLNAADILDRRIKQWIAWDPENYGGFGPPPENAPLLYPAGSHERSIWNNHSWPTMSSLRNVDATCEAIITNHYHDIEEGDEI